MIIYNNCSEDNTSEAVKPYLSDERFTYHRHATVINNFNYALDNCKTDYLLIVHDDDIMLPDMVKEEIAILDSNNDFSIVWTNMNYMSSDGKTIINPSVISIYMDNKDCIINSREYIKLLISKTNVIVCPAVMFRMSIIKAYNFHFRSDIGGGADCFMWLELNQINYKFYYINKALYNYRIHEQQDSSRSLFLLPKIRKPVYFLLEDNNYSNYIKRKWIHYVDRILLTDIYKTNNRKRIFNELKEKILFHDGKDYYLLIKLYYLLNEPFFLRNIRTYCRLNIKILWKITKKFIPIQIQQNIRKYIK